LRNQVTDLSSQDHPFDLHTFELPLSLSLLSLQDLQPPLQPGHIMMHVLHLHKTVSVSTHTPCHRSCIAKILYQESFYHCENLQSHDFRDAGASDG